MLAAVASVVWFAAATLQSSSAWPLVRVRSPDARHEAVIEKVAGQQQVRDPLARWRLVVTRVGDGNAPAPLWECAYPYQGRGQFALANGGLVFGAALEPYMPGQPVVRIHREGAESVSLRGSALEIERAALVPGVGGLAWIAAGSDALRFEWRDVAAGPELVLAIEGRGARTHRIDVCSGALASDDAGLPSAPFVEPAVSAEESAGLDVPYVDTASAPGYARTGSALELGVLGHFPTPNWYVAGYELTQSDPRRNELRLVPRIAPPSASIQAHVLDGFRGSPRLDGLASGRWTISVEGREEQHAPPLSIVVLPERLRARFAQRAPDGSAHVREYHAPGIAGSPDGSRWRLLTARDAANLDARIEVMPARPAYVARELAVAPTSVQLGWWANDRWNEWAGAAAAMPLAVRDLSAALQRE
jgi:hypothetical protein